ncbi:MAG: hypothetical protein HRU38_08475 [Saccharospirillaceae bacterium]|nr:hypothetical protein [Pseudomonadales bacterium]NRB78688.1 hypothetical protein [Saccharospirillaceae bacterium]
MGQLQVKHIKTYVSDETEECKKAYQFLALSNGQFDVDTFEVTLFPEGWWSNDEPSESKRFNDFFTASTYIKSLSPHLDESDIYDPVDAVNFIEQEHYRQNWEAEQQADINLSNKLHQEKQARCDEIPMYEATCKVTGDRKVFSGDTEEEVLKLAEMYFSGGVLKFERVNVKV